MARNNKGTGTVQTLLSARKPNLSSSERPSKEAKRTFSDVSMDSSVDLAIIQSDLENIKTNLEGVVKKVDLDKAINKLVKTNELEKIVTSIVSKLMNGMKKELDERFSEKSAKQEKAIENLTQENEELRELIAEQRRVINDLKTSVSDSEVRSKEAVKMSNYNEQYSRKFNIKVMNYKENLGENLKSDFIEKIAKETLNVTIEPSEIQAIHRIHGKKGEASPVLVKFVNSAVKTRIMRVKKNLPKHGLRLVDDVTKQNMGLITRIRNTEKFESVWYFNCGVYAKTKDGPKIKFDIFDDIEKKLRN